MLEVIPTRGVIDFCVQEPSIIRIGDINLRAIKMSNNVPKKVALTFHEKRDLILHELRDYKIWDPIYEYEFNLVSPHYELFSFVCSIFEFHDAQTISSKFPEDCVYIQLPGHTDAETY